MDDENSISATDKTSLFMSQKNKRKRWKQAETELFLKCVVPHLGEFRSRKKVFAFQNVLKDMFDQGFVDESVTPRTLEGKFRTLSMAYDAYKENPFPGSATTHIQPHLKELEIIFGSKSALKEDQSNESADESAAMRSENVSSDYEMESFTFSDTEDPLLEVKKQSSESERFVEPVQKNLNERQQFSPTQTVIKESLTEFSNTTAYDRDCAQQEYYEAKLNYKKRSLALKAKFYSDMKDLLKEKFKREETMEKEKLEVLKKIAERLCKPRQELI